MFRVGLGLVIFVVFFVFSKLFTFVIFKFKKSDKDNKNSQNLLFDFIIKGEYCETKEMMIKNYTARIKKIEHDSL